MYSLKVESRFKYIPLYLLYNTPPSDSYNTSSSSFLSKNRRNQPASHRIHHPPLATFAYSKHKRQRSDTFSDPSKYSQRKNHIYPYHRFPNKSGLQLAEPNDKLRQRTQIQLMKKANHLARSRPSQSRAFRHAQNLVSNAERRCRTDNWGLPLFYHRNKSGDQSSSSHSSSTIPSATASIQSNSFEADSHNLKGDLNRTRASTYSNDSDSDYVTDTAPSAPKIHFTSTKTNSFPNAHSLSVARSGSRSFFGSIGMIFTYTLVLCRKSFSFLGEFLISIRRFAFRKFNPASAIFDLSMSKKFGNTYTQISAKKKTNSTLAIPCNYQIYSASAQYNLQKSRHCDYRQPPMSLIQGILQGAIVDYHYPGYNKNFPALWLPVSS
ncbi:hypothetical protein AX774_g6923 [Zancudomyces culisetae]|uniref:Uncharacterized protein n=1 Tax=Zancudomyces culisetae TaxID=1213189 RepID=A0A1R1PF82_ZANCU|nr:hypothetical protein AX774_g6923 [Zancudomyces culisetae]|eukprot:OMH79660.1 hypothetical protein AX774_g6923 [Zancudomyces culisetae]